MGFFEKRRIQKQIAECEREIEDCESKLLKIDAKAKAAEKQYEQICAGLADVLEIERKDHEAYHHEHASQQVIKDIRLNGLESRYIDSYPMSKRELEAATQLHQYIRMGAPLERTPLAARQFELRIEIDRLKKLIS